MNKYISTAIFFFLCSFHFSLSQESENQRLILNLREGDSFTYNIESIKSYLIAHPREDSVLRSLKNTSQHTFTIIKRKPGNRYLINYKIDYVINENWVGSNVSITDSRFPPFENNVFYIYECFMNTVVYKIEFSPFENSLKLLNLEEINRDLFEYLEERGLQISSYTKSELQLKRSDFGVIMDILYLNFYPKNGMISPTWTVDQITEEQERFQVHGQIDSTISIFSERPYTGFDDENGLVEGKGMKLFTLLQVNNKTGLLQLAETASYLFPDSIRTENIYQKRSDITDFRSRVKLVAFSRNSKKTILCGQIHNPSFQKLCLVSPASIVGLDKDFHYIEIDVNGRFQTILDLIESKRYQLYYLEKYPIRRNKRIQLYIEPGDSISISIDSTLASDNIIFAGRGFQNSKFLNDFYQEMQYTKYTGSRMYPHVSFTYPTYDIWEELIEVLPIMSEYLEERKLSISRDFYEYFKFELLCVSLRANLIIQENDRLTHGTETDKITGSIELLKDTLNPMYELHKNMEQYNFFIGVHTLKQLMFIWNMSPGISHIGFGNFDNITYTKLFLKGYPMYVEATRIVERMLLNSFRRYDMQIPIYQNILSSCNNQEVREYILKHVDAYSRIQRGNEIPEMELIGMDGSSINWKQTKNKVIVLMVYNEYTQEQQFCEELYNEFGENKKEVIVLRISPGIDYKNWKSFNERYSDKDFQLYFEGGESLFNGRFGFVGGFTGAKYFVIGKDGRIFSNTVRLQIKREIKKALKEEDPPNEFLNTLWSRIVPGIIIGVILTFVLSRIIYRRRFAKQVLESKIAELEQKAIKAQLNPHFLFNCLNSIQNLIRTDRKNDADKYISKFAVLIRQVLKNSEKEEISIFEEINNLKIYLELEQMRFDFSYDIISEEDIDLYNAMIPPMLLHPIVENAILHGLDPKKGDRKLSIGIQKEGDSIRFSIEDNGVGRDSSPKKKVLKESRGLKLTESRMALLSQSSKEKFDFIITDKKDNDGKPAGTLIEIIIPDEV